MTGEPAPSKQSGVLFSALLPGAGQYCSGARLRGLVWLLTLFLAPGAALLLVSQTAIGSFLPALAAGGLWILLWAWMLLDARRAALSDNRPGVLSIALCGAGAFLITHAFWARFCAQVILIPNQGMAPALSGQTLPNGHIKGDLAVVQRWAYWHAPPRRGDVVLCRIDGLATGSEKGSVAFRVVGLPGERVAISGNRLTIDGAEVASPSVFKTLRHQAAPQARLLSSPEASFVVPENHYFVLGDNPADSFDSRFWGPVPRSQVVGRVSRVLWPLDRATVLE